MAADSVAEPTVRQVVAALVGLGERAGAYRDVENDTYTAGYFNLLASLRRRIG
jgi:hypothetical protein